MFLYLDDVRIPDYNDAVLVRNFQDFRYYVDNMPQLIEAISFDHDLGDIFTGLDCANFLEAAVEKNPAAFSSLTGLYCHSMNPVGRKQILDAIDSIKKMLNL